MSGDAVARGDCFTIAGFVCKLLKFALEELANGPNRHQEAACVESDG